MDTYKAGDLSKMLQMSSPNAVTLPKVKKAKKTPAKIPAHQEQNNTNQTVPQEDKIPIVEKSPKKRKKSLEQKDGSLISKETEQVKTDAPAKKKIKTQETNEELPAVADNKGGGGKGKKQKAKKTKLKKMETTPKQNSGIPGYNPPAGIVHESLLKKRKGKIADDDEADEDDAVEEDVADEEDLADEDVITEEKAGANSKDKAKKKQRPRKDRLFKKLEDQTIFVGNVSLKIDKKGLTKVFKKYGEIESVRLRCIPVNDLKLPKRAIAIKKQFHPERHNCVAFIQFKKAEDAKKSLKSNGELLDGLHIQVDMASRNKTYDNRRAVFVGNLPFDIEEEAVRTHFEDCGKIEAVRIVRDKTTCLGKGFGYVTFADQDAVEFAVKLNNQPLKGRALRVTHCTSAKKTKKENSNKHSKQKGSKTAEPGNETSFQGEIGKKEGKKEKRKNKRKDMKNKTKIVFKVKSQQEKIEQKPSDLEKKAADSHSDKISVDKNCSVNNTGSNDNTKTKSGGKGKQVSNETNNKKGGGKEKHQARNAFKHLKPTADQPETKNVSPEKPFERSLNGKPFENKGKFGGKPFENKGKFSGKPFENKGKFGDKPFENKGKFGGKPFENRGKFGGKPFENEGKFGGKPLENKGKFGGKPFENKGKFGGKPYENKGKFGGKPYENKSKFGDNRPSGQSFKRNFNKDGKSPSFAQKGSIGAVNEGRSNFADKSRGGPGGRFGSTSGPGKKMFTPNKSLPSTSSGKHIKFDE